MRRPIVRLFERIIDEARRLERIGRRERRPRRPDERVDHHGSSDGRAGDRRRRSRTSSRISSSMGFDVHRSTGALRTVIGAVGGQRQADPRLLEVLDGVHEVLRITEPYKLASRTFKPDNTVITVGDAAHRRRRSDRHGRPLLGRERRAGRDDARPRSSAPAPRSCAAARSSRAARPTASRGSAKTACRCCARPPTATT